MKGRHLEISGAPHSGDCKVLLDGQEIQSALFGLQLAMGARDELPTLELDVRVLDVETRDLLIRLGWTPPNKETKA